MSYPYAMAGNSARRRANGNGLELQRHSAATWPWLTSCQTALCCNGKVNREGSQRSADLTPSQRPGLGQQSHSLPDFKRRLDYFLPTFIPEYGLLISSNLGDSQSDHKWYDASSAFSLAISPIRTLLPLSFSRFIASPPPNKVQHGLPRFSTTSTPHGRVCQ